MKRLVEWIEATFAASAFAEVGEADAARRIVEEAGRGGPDDGGGRAPRAR